MAKQIGVIFFENTTRAGAVAQSKFKSVDSAYRSFTNYEGTSKPSLPDYEAFIAGTYSPAPWSEGVFGGNPAGRDGPSGIAPGYWGSQPNLISQLIGAGVSWKTYEEGVTGHYTAWSNTTSKFASRHCPASFFTGTKGAGSAHGSGRYDFDELAYDISHSSFPEFFFITPDTINDGHDNGVADGNTWLKNTTNGFDAILAAMDPDGLLFVSFDNVPVADTSKPVTGSGVIYAVIAGQGVTHSSDNTYYTHFSMLKGIQNYFGLSNFTSGVDAAYLSAAAINLGGSTDTTAPSAPSSVSATAVSAGQISVAFSGAADETGGSGIDHYEVWRSTGGGAYAKVGSPVSSPYVDGGLAASTAYTYKVKTIDKAGNTSGFSSTSSATTSAASGDTTPPSAPANLKATVISSTEIDLSIGTTSTDNTAVTGYQWYRDDGKGGAFTSLGTSSGTTFAATNLSPGTTYNFRAQAFDAAGNHSANSNTAGATTQAGAGVDSLTDSGDRNVTNGWGTATSGQPWTQDQGDSDQPQVVSGTGLTLQMKSGKAPIMAVKSISQQDYDVTITVKSSSQPAGAIQNITGCVRYVDALNYTRLVAQQAPGGNLNLVLQRQINNVNTSLGTWDSGATMANGTLYKMRIQAIGTTIKCKWWLASATEPTAWQITGTDNVAPVVSGGVGVRAQAVTGNTNLTKYTVTAIAGSVPGSPGGGGTGGTATVHDDSGNGLDGSLIAGTSGVLPVGVAGPNGSDRALQFDGTGGRIEIVDSIGSLNAAHWTIAAWVKLANPPGDVDPVHQRYEVLEKAGAYWINIRYDTTPKYVVRIGSFFGPAATFVHIDSTTALVPGTWAHVCGTYDGATLKIYLNGTQNVSVAQTGDSAGTSEPLVIGSKHRYQNGELLEGFMNGAISHVAVFDHALTSAEVAALKTAQFPIWVDEGATFSPANPGDEGKILRAKQVAVNPTGKASAYGPISAPIAHTASTSVPVNTQLPALSDTTPTEGDTITAIAGHWTGTPAPALSRQIQYASSVSGPWTNAAPTGQSFSLPADGSFISRYLSVLETGTNSAGTKSVRSAISSPIAAAGTNSPPTNSIKPVISPSTVQAGVTLHSTEGVWNGDTDDPVYTWYERASDGASASIVQGPDSDADYTPSDTDVEIRSKVTHTNDNGSTDALSDWIGPPVPASITPLYPRPGQTVKTAAIMTQWSITGDIPAGQAFYVRADGGPWTQADQPSKSLLTCAVSLIGGDGDHLIEGDVH